jgi:ribosome-associated translation inhibitor RaiA
MNILAAIKREEKKLEKQLKKVQHQLMELDQPQKLWVTPPPWK